MNTLTSEQSRFIGKIALGLLPLSPAFKAELQSSFPQIYADIESASTNPNCTCRNKVEKHLIENKDSATTVVNSFLLRTQDDPKIQQVIDTDYQALMPKPYAGKMFSIPNTETDYSQFISKITQDKASFRYMSTAVSQETLYIYFA